MVYAIRPDIVGSCTRHAGPITPECPGIGDCANVPSVLTADTVIAYTVVAVSPARVTVTVRVTDAGYEPGPIAIDDMPRASWVALATQAETLTDNLESEPCTICGDYAPAGFPCVNAWCPASPLE